MNIIDQIIELKRKYNNVHGETYSQLYRHYKNLLLDRRLEILRDEDGHITGFLGWTRQPNLSFPIGRPDYGVFSGKYVYIINAVIEKGNIWDLVKALRKKNKTAEYVVWDDKNGVRHIHKVRRE